MSEFTFNNPSTGGTFVIKGPNGLTFDQAQAIFKQQLDTGSLTGFKVGDALSAATQVADGLASAQASLSQGLGSLAGKLPSGADLSTITAGLGPAAAAAAGQVQSALTGAIPKISSITTGASSAINGALSGLTSQLPNLSGSLSASVSGLTSQLPVISGALTGQAAQLGSVANNALKTLTDSVKGVPLDGINLANFSKQVPALGSIGNLNLNDVTGTLAQATKMVGQSFDKITNQLGAGKFGFDASQLEKAGMIKPGTAAAFLQAGNNDLTDVLKSPAVWTGKDGIKGLDGLLKNPGLQDKIQQGLMSTGLNDIKQMGIPVDKLNPAALSGLATNAAKSVEGTMAWLKNAPEMPKIPTVPGGDVKAAFNNMATNGAFAVNFTNDKVDSKLKQEEPVNPATNTVNTETVDAASKRVVGNDKVPDTGGNGAVSAARTAVIALSDFIDEQFSAAKDLENRLIEISNPWRLTSITQEQWNALNEERNILRATFNSRFKDLDAAMSAAINATPAGDERIRFIKAGTAVQATAKLFVELAIRINKLVKDLANKIAT